VETAEVETTNVADDCPDEIVTELGTVAATFALESDTVVPAELAGPDSVTVPVEAVPPVTEVGFRLNEARAPAVIVRVAVCDTEPVLPVITAIV